MQRVPYALPWKHPPPALLMYGKWTAISFPGASASMKKKSPRPSAYRCVLPSA